MNRDKTHSKSDDLAEMPEWTDADWARAKPNRFANHFVDTATVVLLDSDVAEVFTTPAAVNKALRALIQAMPAPPSPKRVAKTTASRPDTIPTATK